MILIYLVPVKMLLVWFEFLTARLKFLHDCFLQAIEAMSFNSGYHAEGVGAAEVRLDGVCGCDASSQVREIEQKYSN